MVVDGEDGEDGEVVTLLFELFELFEMAAFLISPKGRRGDEDDESWSSPVESH